MKTKTKKRSKRQREIKEALRYEKLMSTLLGARHIGGPGKPDYIRRGRPGEVKDWDRPMTKSDVMKEIHKGRKEIISKNGFTKNAIEYVKRYYKDKVRLYHKLERVA